MAKGRRKKSKKGDGDDDGYLHPTSRAILSCLKGFSLAFFEFLNSYNDFYQAVCSRGQLSFTDLDQRRTGPALHAPCCLSCCVSTQATLPHAWYCCGCSHRDEPHLGIVGLGLCWVPLNQAQKRAERSKSSASSKRHPEPREPSDRDCDELLPSN